MRREKKDEERRRYWQKYLRRKSDRKHERSEYSEVIIRGEDPFSHVLEKEEEERREDDDYVRARQCTQIS